MEEYDLIIIGAGVSGLAGGMYSARLGLKTLILGASSGSEMPVGGTITVTNFVENYPGFIRISGIELAEKMRKHAEIYDLATIKQEKANDIRKKGGKFLVKTDEKEYLGKSVLFATGTKWRDLEIPGGKEFKHRGVNYCALCDAALYKNKTVCVVGGSDVAVRDALILSEYAKKVYIIYRKEKVRAEQANLELAEKNERIEIIKNTNVLEVKGKDFVESVVLDKKYKGKKELKLDGVFVAIGHVALSELAEKLGVKLNLKDEIIIDRKTSKTNVEGIFGAGDVTDRPFKQVIIGVSEACVAAHSAYEYCSNK